MPRAPPRLSSSTRPGAWRLRPDTPRPNQTEERLEEGVFSVFKARVKPYLAEHRQRMFVQCAHLNMTEARMSLLEDAATVSISCMNRHLVVATALHCQRFVADALKMEDMEYGCSS
ncbi:hypothetical protein GQ600_17414 [Phytophthora cactorum]|nr:hypothetical protein GQ600_17414 [Phytophthora cactorum]